MLIQQNEGQKTPEENQTTNITNHNLNYIY